MPLQLKPGPMPPHDMVDSVYAQKLDLTYISETTRYPITVGAFLMPRENVVTDLESTREACQACPVYSHNFSCPPHAPAFEVIRPSAKSVLFGWVRTDPYEMRRSNPDLTPSDCRLTADRLLYSYAQRVGRTAQHRRSDGGKSPFLLGAASCRRCKPCAAKTGADKCAFPKERVFSLEATGVRVDWAMARVGLPLQWFNSRDMVPIVHVIALLGNWYGLQGSECVSIMLDALCKDKSILPLTHGALFEAAGIMDGEDEQKTSLPDAPLEFVPEEYEELLEDAERDPDPEDSVIAKLRPRLVEMRRMRALDRFQCFPRNKPQNVSDHQGNVALLAMLIADDIVAQNANTRLDIEWILRASIVHDSDEIYTGDIPWHMKHVHGMNSAVDKAAAPWRLAFWSAFSKRIFDLMSAGPKSNGADGQVVAMADALDGALYCWEEVLSGNAAMLGIWGDYIDLCHTTRRTVAATYSLAAPLAWGIARTMHREYLDELRRRTGGDVILADSTYRTTIGDYSVEPGRGWPGVMDPWYEVKK
jgi:5'-deoxynucleotidase YfbR-like HD superfamily hydrolase/predicted metal-binding protein